MSNPDFKLFWACFAALLTISFAFILTAFTLPQWGAEFQLSNTQMGEIAGVGLWPFAFSVVLISLFVDRIGYKNAMAFAFVCHNTAVILIYLASDYWSLYSALMILALGNGTAAAVINPVVASLFATDKTKWFNVLHAGWPAGLVLGGLLALMMGEASSWRFKMILILLPATFYAVLMFPRKFPVSERVRAKVPYLTMLKEVGIFGTLIVTGLIIFQLGALLEWQTFTRMIVTLVIVGIFGFFVRSWGQPIFVFLLLLMIPVTITELGTDTWITDLMATEMDLVGLQPGWILVYTAIIMIVLRFMAGHIVKYITPLGLLAASSAVAAIGLILLSSSAGIMILLAATIFGAGKTFFMPTMLGVVAERFPRGGALTLNITSAVGMLAAGMIGAVIVGYLQDSSIDRNLKEYDALHNTLYHETYATIEKTSYFGEYRGLDTKKLSEKASEDARVTVKNIEEEAKKDSLKMMAIFPVIMLIGYVLMIVYFRSKGGYKPVDLNIN